MLRRKRCGIDLEFASNLCPCLIKTLAVYSFNISILTVG